jgi:mutator protein MutT
MENSFDDQNKNHLTVVGAVIQRWVCKELQVLLVRRGPGQSGAGDWEFPGGKVERGEAPEEALAREIEEELGLQILVKEKIGENCYSYPHRTIKLSLFWATISQGHLQLREHDAFEWLSPGSIILEKLSPADRHFIRLLL